MTTNPFPQRKPIKDFARSMRASGTNAEAVLWSVLRNRQLAKYKFRSQHPIGPYIADFVCLEEKLIIEADGGQHNDNQKDVVRTAWLEARGYRVLRFWNNDILQNREGVFEMILEELEKKSISENPSPAHDVRDLSLKGRGKRGTP